MYNSKCSEEDLCTKQEFISSCCDFKTDSTFFPRSKTEKRIDVPVVFRFETADFAFDSFQKKE